MLKNLKKQSKAALITEIRDLRKIVEHLTEQHAQETRQLTDDISSLNHIKNYLENKVVRLENKIQHHERSHKISRNQIHYRNRVITHVLDTTIHEADQAIAGSIPEVPELHQDQARPQLGVDSINTEELKK